MQKGTISVMTENIFPVIKKFLYSDQEIFLRELVSNAVDATTKLQILASRGELGEEMGDTTIDVLVDKKKKTLTIRDKGIGMTEEEVLKYLNQIAFSSAKEWLENAQQDQHIIGQFGLGFYSAFMVAEKVEVITRSWKKEAEPVTWACTGTPEYTLEKNEKKQRGTDIVLHISEDAKEFLDKDRIESLLLKYCKFLPVPIRFGTRKETVSEGEGEERKEKQVEVDNIINNTRPAWKRPPAELEDREYQDFYRELYPFGSEPMFWIHLNIDFPFNLTGILYFPKLSNNFEVQKNKIQLYSNQVYVTDDVKEIVPEWLTLLHGVIDSPDIPLNVSRSYLQSDSNVRKINSYISKKVAERLLELFKKDRKEFEGKWEHVGLFVKYGMMSEDKFYERALKFALVRNTANDFFTLDEYKDKIEDAQKDKNGKIICLYTNNPQEHDSYIRNAEKAGYDVLVFDQVIDAHFLQHLEYKRNDLTFRRVDADTLNKLIEKEESNEFVLSEKEREQVKGIFEKNVAAEGATVTLEALSPEDPPVQITKPEFMRRMKEMQSLQGLDLGGFPDTFNVVVNANNKLVAKKLAAGKEEEQDELARYLIDLALLNQNMLKGEALTAFINKAMDFVK